MCSSDLRRAIPSIASCTGPCLQSGKLHSLMAEHNLECRDLCKIYVEGAELIVQAVSAPKIGPDNTRQVSLLIRFWDLLLGIRDRCVAHIVPGRLCFSQDVSAGGLISELLPR